MQVMFFYKILFVLRYGPLKEMLTNEIRDVTMVLCGGMVDEVFFLEIISLIVMQKQN